MGADRHLTGAVEPEKLSVMRIAFVAVVCLVAACGGRTEPLGQQSVDRPDASTAGDATVEDVGPALADAGPRDAGPCNQLLLRAPDFAEFERRFMPTANESLDREPVVKDGLDFPYVTQAGLRFAEAGGPVTAQIERRGPINGSPSLRLRDFGASLDVEVPGDHTVLGFRFIASERGWTATIGGRRLLLAVEPTPRFVGVQTDCANLLDIRFTGPAGAQGGLALDDFYWRQAP